MTIETKSVPSVSVTYARNGSSTKSNELGMRTMQERAYEKRGEQYLLIKSPPASGKSRALMFITLDKLRNQDVKQAIIVVPEKSIGSSFNDEPLSKYGFWADWVVAPKWNLCNAPGEDGSKVSSVGSFLASNDEVLVCTHQTFRFAVDKFGVEAFDGRLIAVDEFHHVSSNPDNKLGAHLTDFIARDKVHIVAMTGSYFRGDTEAVLSPLEEEKFEKVTYTYYEQLNGYDYLKQLDIGYFFYSDAYIDDILKVLDPAEKTIVHIPSVNSRESTKDKIKEVEHILAALGDWQGVDPVTGFQLVLTEGGKLLRIADLVTDDAGVRDKVSMALKDPANKNNRDHVDIIIALGMAKEGFDWIWCEHALTIGYRASLTEIVQIIGRATRDAPGKTKKPQNEATPGFDYGKDGYDPEKCNVGYNQETGKLEIEVNGLAEPKSEEARRICKEDINEILATFVKDKPSIERGLFDHEMIPEELNQVRLGKIIKEMYPGRDAEDVEAIRQHAITAFVLTQQAKEALTAPPEQEESEQGGGDDTPSKNTAFVDGVRKFLSVKDIDIDLIDRINPFGAAYAIMAKTMSEESLRQVAAVIAAKSIKLTPDEARELALRARLFKKERGRLPSKTSADPWEVKMAEGAAAFVRFKDEGRYE